jgi:hypothetical protein
MQYRRAGLLALLMLVNIAVPTLVFGGGVLATHAAMRAGWTLVSNLLLALVPLAAMLLAGDALLLIGLWTALNPTRRPVSRWMAIASVLALGAAAASGCAYIQQLIWSWQGSPFDKVLVAYRLVVVAAGFFTSALIGILAIHVLIWPLRMAFGWRIIWQGDPIQPSDRQFTLAEGMIWVCLISILLAFVKSYIAVDWFSSTLVVGSASVFAAFVVVPACLVTILGRPADWKMVALGGWQGALIAAQIYALLLYSPTPALTWLDIAPYVIGINLLASGTVVATLLMLKRAGAQLVCVRVTAPNVAPVANP